LLMVENADLLYRIYKKVNWFGRLIP
jgi:hypothetical protein